MPRPELDAIPPAIAGRGTGFGCATAQPVASHTISTDTAGLAGGEITVGCNAFALPAYRAMLAGDAPLPIVLVVAEIADDQPSDDRATAADGRHHDVGRRRGHGLA